jgi:hypothetical protein
MTYPNLFVCGNCGRHTNIENADTCVECGMMICGECGDVCATHKKTRKLGFTETQLKKVLTQDQWKEFLTFMNGETVALIEQQIVYYSADVKRFALENSIELTES